MASFTILVKGMTCGGCENALKRALATVDGVESVEADHTTGRVVVHGEGLELDGLRGAIENAGYDWDGVV
jgi:copper chaperone